MTGTNVIVGPWIALSGVEGLSFQNAWTGGVGVFTFEGTNVAKAPGKSVPADDATPATVLSVPASFAPGNPTGSAGNFGHGFSKAPPYAFMRQKYTNSTGAGVLNTGVNIRYR